MISYSRRDSDFVRQLHSQLEQQGLEVWIDWKNIALSADWWKEISDAIEKANSIVFIISPDSLNSPICNLEIDHARANNKRIIPILYRDTEINEAIKALSLRELDQNTLAILKKRDILHVAQENWNTISRHNWILYESDSSIEENVAKLREVLDTDLDHVHTHTRLLVRAREWESRERDGSSLLDGKDITEAENWLSHAAGKHPVPTPLQIDYISASRQRQLGRQRLILTGVSGALVLAVLLSLLSTSLFFVARENERDAQSAAATASYAEDQAVLQANLAATNEAIAEQNADRANSLLWANEAGRTLEQDGSFALALAVQAVSVGEPPAIAKRILAQAAFSPGLEEERILTDEGGTPISINGFDISQDPPLIAIARADGKIKISDWNDSTLIKNVTIHDLPTTAVRFMPRTPELISASLNGEIVLWNYETEAIQLRMLHGQGVNINAIDIDASGLKMLSAGSDNRVIVWDLQTGEQQAVFSQHTDNVNDITFSNNGRWGISASSDDTVLIWDIQTAEVLRQFTMNSDVLSVTYSPDGRTIATGERDGSVNLWDINSGTLLTQFGTVPPNHQEGIIDLTFSEDGSSLLSIDEFATLIVWDVQTYQFVRIFKQDDEIAEGISFLNDRGRLAVALQSGKISLWNIEEASVLYRYNRHSEEISAIAVSEETNSILTGTNNGEIHLWSLSDGRRISQFNGVSAINTLQYNPTEESFAVGDDEGVVSIWDVQNNRIIRTLSNNTVPIKVITYNPDGNQLLVGNDDGELVLWDLDSSKPRYTLSGQYTTVQHRRAIRSLAINEDGTRALSGAEDRTIMVWDLTNGQHLQTLEGHNRRVLGVDFATVDGKDVYYSVSDDDNVFMWDAETGSILKSFSLNPEQSPDQVLRTVSFSTEHDRVAVGYSIGMIQVYELPSGDLVEVYYVDGKENATLLGINTIAYSQGNNILGVGLNSNTALALRSLPFEQLLEWVYENRAIRSFTCTERASLNIEPPCEADSSTN